MIGKRLRKIIRQLLLIFCILKKNKYFQLIFQNINHNTNNSVNDSKSRKRKMALSCSKNRDFYGTVMPSEKKKILKFNPYMKSDKMPYII